LQIPAAGRVEAVLFCSWAGRAAVRLFLDRGDRHDGRLWCRPARAEGPCAGRNHAGRDRARPRLAHRLCALRRRVL